MYWKCALSNEHCEDGLQNRLRVSRWLRSGSRSISASLALIWVLCSPLHAMDAISVWANSSDRQPQYSLLSSGVWSTQAAALDVGGYPNWVVVRSCPVRAEFACGTHDSSSDVNIQFFDGSTWSGLSELSSSSGNSSEKRPFDLAYEGSSGELLVVYSDSGEGNLGYRTYDGTTLSSESDLSLPGSGTTGWVALHRDVNSDRVILLHIDSSYDLDANIWDGSSWSGWTELTDDTGWDVTERSTVSFESSSGDGLVVYRGGYSNTYSRTLSGSTWSSPTILATSELMTFASLASCQAAGSDEIVLAYNNYYDEVVWRVWDGTSWSSSTILEVASATWNRRCVDVCYEPGGTNAVVAYCEAGINTVRYRVWNGSSLSSEQSGADLGGSGGFLQLLSLLDTPEILLSLGDTNRDLNCSLWAGTALGASEELETSLPSGTVVRGYMAATASVQSAVTVTNWREVPR